jgi:hypothetical protein
VSALGGHVSPRVGPAGPGGLLGLWAMNAVRDSRRRP